MKKIISFFIILITISCSITEEKLLIEFNPNVATYSIVERLVADHNKRLFYIDGKQNYSYIPMVEKAFNKFKNNDNSAIIKSTLNYLSIVGNQQDLTYEALVRSNKFPKKGFKYSFEKLNIEKEKINAVKKYIQDLKYFYLENNLNAFFEENKNFIKGGIYEFKENVPDNYVEKLEKYYGESFLKFIIFPDSFNTYPMDKNENDFFHGNGQKIHSNEGKIATMISSSFLPINIDKQPGEYGFNHPDYVKFIVTHEFGHSFVNHTLENVKEQINATENLFTPELFKKMKGQGYRTWTNCLTEHLVRLGEIRIAETNGEKKRAKELRKMHIEDFHFILIPTLEKKIVEYEQNREKYPTYQDFLPELLTVLINLNSK